ncbi:MAG: DUF2274 domain-containing protein [Thiobacillus sp.]|nr:DUF2274 domain-containing protein [Thiobacillus sp.]
MLLNKAAYGACLRSRPQRSRRLLSVGAEAGYRDILAYAEALAAETGQSITEPAKLIGPMVQRFIATDRAFARARRKLSQSEKGAI